MSPPRPDTQRHALTIPERVAAAEARDLVHEKAIDLERQERKESCAGIGARVGAVETDVGAIKQALAHDQGRDEVKDEEARRAAAAADDRAGKANVAAKGAGGVALFDLLWRFIEWLNNHPSVGGG